MILQHLFERVLLERHPDRLDALDPWFNNPDIYVSFTDLPKIGINPQSPYDTPLGIYAYPLREMYRHIEADDIPYASDRAYIQVLESTTVTELSQYSEADLHRDLDALRRKFSASLDGAKFDRLTADWTRQATRPHDPASQMWNITRNLSKLMVGGRRPLVLGGMAAPHIIAWNSILRGLGYSAFSDKKGRAIIHGNEPIAAVFLSKSAFKHLKTIHNIVKHEAPQRFGTLAEITRLLKAAKVDKNTTALRLRGHILAEWPKLLHGQGDRIELAANVSPAEFPAFMQQLLLADFDRQLPVVAKELGYDNFFGDAGVVQAFLAVVPTRPQIKTYVAVMLGSYVTADAAHALYVSGAVEGHEAADRAVGTAVAAALSRGLGVPLAGLQARLDADHWRRLTSLIPADALLEL